MIRSLSRRAAIAACVTASALLIAGSAASGVPSDGAPAQIRTVGAVSSLTAPAGGLPGAQTRVQPGSSVSHSVPRIVTAWADAWNSAEPERMAALFTHDAIYEDFAFQGSFRGKDGVAQWVSITHQGIPDAHVEIVDAFRSGNRVAVRFIFTGTPVAFGPDIPSTGESFSVPATSIFEMEGRRIHRVSDYYNLADLLRQVGLPSGPWVPPSATPAA